MDTVEAFNNELKEMSLYEKKNLLLFRSAIISKDASWIISTVPVPGCYFKILDMVSYALSKDQNFFYLNHYLDKTQYIISTLGYKFNKNEEANEVLNSIKKDFNNLKIISNTDKEQKIKEYLEEQFLARSKLPDKNELIYISMANDYVVYSMLMKAYQGCDKLKKINCSQFIQSTSYLTTFVPELYQLYPELYEISTNRMNELKKDNKIYRKFIKKTQKKLDEFKS